MEKKPSQPERRMSFEELEPFFDAHEVAASCRVSEKSLHKWAREGRIPAVKFGRLAVSEVSNQRFSWQKDGKLMRTDPKMFAGHPPPSQEKP